jgi:hypothetical protein
MLEVIGLENITVDYKQALKEALQENGFLEFRVNPRFRNEKDFISKIKGSADLLAHFFRTPTGSELKDMPEIMEDRILSVPRDIREVIAIGKTIKEEVCDYLIYAPQITGQPRSLLRIMRYPEWQGFGLTISNHDPDDENFWDHQFIGFSQA